MMHPSNGTQLVLCLSASGMLRFMFMLIRDQSKTVKTHKIDFSQNDPFSRYRDDEWLGENVGTSFFLIGSSWGGGLSGCPSCGEGTQGGDDSPCSAWRRGELCCVLFDFILLGWGYVITTKVNEVHEWTVPWVQMKRSPYYSLLMDMKSIRASSMRWVFFKGYTLHETRPSDEVCQQVYHGSTIHPFQSQHGVCCNTSLIKPSLLSRRRSLVNE
jgi:hypothetical protein